jgi:hypothetical protein
MRISTRRAGGATLGLLISVFVAGCSSSAAPAPTGTAASPTEQPLAPETSPAGDIPDNQVFVAYASPTGGYQLQVPEGWARTDQGSDVRFVSKLDGVQVAVTNASSVPTAATLQANPALVQGFGRAVQVIKVQDVQLPAGPAVLVDFASNSDPDPVTAKQVRLENNTYLIAKNGKLATLTLWAPQGADNVDQWQQMAQSFTWR